MVRVIRRTQLSDTLTSFEIEVEGEDGRPARDEADTGTRESPPERSYETLAKRVPDESVEAEGLWISALEFPGPDEA